MLLNEQGLELTAFPNDTDLSDPSPKMPLMRHESDELPKKSPVVSERTPTRVIAYHCSCCTFIAQKMSVMSNHMRIHGSTAAVACPTCLTKYKSLAGYKRHFSVCMRNLDQVEDVNGESYETDKNMGLNDDERSSNYMYGLA